MATIRTTYKFTCDLDRGTTEVNLRNPLMQSDAFADEFAVSITRNGNPVDVSNMTVYAYLYTAATQKTILFDGSASGNTAAVVLQPFCYAEPGFSSIAVQIAEGDILHTVLKVNFSVSKTGTDYVIDGDNVLPGLQELLGMIASVEQATDAANEAAAAADAAREGIQGDLAALSEDIAEAKDDLNVLVDKTELHNVRDTLVNSLRNDYVWVFANDFIPKDGIPQLTIVSATDNSVLSILLFRKVDDTHFALKQEVQIECVAGKNAVDFDNMSIFAEDDTYIGFYSNNGGITYNTYTNTQSLVRCLYADIDANTEIEMSGSFTMGFSYVLTYKRPKPAKISGTVIVDISGNGNYTSVGEAIENEPENTVIFVLPGVYDEEIDCREKRVIVIGADRNQCIIRNRDGRYGHHALYCTCGYFENLTIIEPYESGVSQEIGADDLGAYAVHVDTSEYGIGKQLEFHHCNISSDFFPAIGCGLRKDFTLVLDDCELVNNQIVGRGDYSDEGSLGALYFHDSNGAQGEQYIKLKNCVLKSSLGNTMTPYQVDRETQNNKVYCEFVNNVFYDKVNGYTNNIWFRNDPFNPTTGVFDITIGCGNSNSELNN